MAQSITVECADRLSIPYNLYSRARFDSMVRVAQILQGLCPLHKVQVQERLYGRYRSAFRTVKKDSTV